MPRKKRTTEDVKEIIDTLEKENATKIANKQLEIHFAKYQQDKLRLTEFQERLHRKSSEYNLQSLSNLNTNFTGISNS